MGKEKMLVRLKPYNPRRGCVLRRFCYRQKVYYEGNWYKVSEELALDLSHLYQKHNDADSQFAFDVATKKQAQAIEDKEKSKLEAERRKVSGAEVVDAREVREAKDLTTNDLPGISKELYLSMESSKKDLLHIAKSVGLTINPKLNKKEIINAIQEEVGTQI